MRRFEDDAASGESGMRAAVNHDLTEEVTSLRERLVEVEAEADRLGLELTTVNEDRDEVAQSLGAAEAEAPLFKRERSLGMLGAGEGQAESGLEGFLER